MRAGIIALIVVVRRVFLPRGRAEGTLRVPSRLEGRTIIARPGPEALQHCPSPTSQGGSSDPTLGA